MTRKPAFKTSPSNSAIKEVQTIPERSVDMPHAPAIRVESPCGLLFHIGCHAIAALVRRFFVDPQTQLDQRPTGLLIAIMETASRR